MAERSEADCRAPVAHPAIFIGVRGVAVKSFRRGWGKGLGVPKKISIACKKLKKIFIGGACSPDNVTNH